MERDKALELVKQNLSNKNLVKHCLAVEACMREFARQFNEDVESWGLAGLLHDLDYDSTFDDPDRHALKTAEMLEEYHLPDEIIHAIKAHNQKAEMKSKMDIALFTADPTTGFIIACALMHPDKKLKSLDLRFLQKRFKEKSFARGASREHMRESAKLGLELDDFLLSCLRAMQQIDTQLGL
jgi:putative nucleotidyltransferase with HDIG domain